MNRIENLEKLDNIFNHAINTTIKQKDEGEFFKKLVNLKYENFLEIMEVDRESNQILNKGDYLQKLKDCMEIAFALRMAQEDKSEKIKNIFEFHSDIENELEKEDETQVAIAEEKFSTMI